LGREENYLWGFRRQLIDMGNVEFAGIDYLIAYWMGRYHGFIQPEE
jgi:hypothetical protein